MSRQVDPHAAERLDSPGPPRDLPGSRTPIPAPPPGARALAPVAAPHRHPPPAAPARRTHVQARRVDYEHGLALGGSECVERAVEDGAARLREAELVAEQQSVEVPQDALRLEDRSQMPAGGDAGV